MGLHMALTLIHSGALKVVVSYVEPRKQGYYFRRRIPDDLKKMYPGKSQIFFSLKTRDAKIAAVKAQRLAADQDALWKAHREGHEVTPRGTDEAARALLQAHDLRPGDAALYAREGVGEGRGLIDPEHFLETLRVAASGDEGEILWDGLPPVERKAAELYHGVKSIPTFTEVRDEYIRLGLVSPSLTSNKAFYRETSEFLALLGDLPITAYNRAKANEFVQSKVDKGNQAGGIKRILNYISPIFKIAIREFEVDMKNPFEGIIIPNRPPQHLKDQGKRKSVPLERIKAAQEACRKMDDERRWIISILSDTGARLAEVLFLKVTDIHVNDEVPYLEFKFTDTRTLKTAASVRKVPLLGEALWAARRVVETAKGDDAFPTYSGHKLSNSASATLNKWLKEKCIFKDGDTLHGFRHAMRERCDNANVPSLVIDRIGGWTTKGVGEGYGAGHSLGVLRDWLAKAVPLRLPVKDD